MRCSICGKPIHNNIAIHLKNRSIIPIMSPSSTYICKDCLTEMLKTVNNIEKEVEDQENKLEAFIDTLDGLKSLYCDLLLSSEFFTENDTTEIPIQLAINYCINFINSLTSYEQFKDIRELENNCTWEWSTRTGRNGYTVKGKNGNSIFLPANGCLMKGQQFSTKVGEWVYYWSSTKSGDMANIMMCTSSDVWYGEMNTTMTKLPIRPITKSMSSDIREGVASSDNNSPEIIGIYDLQGHKLDDLGKGMNIVKMSNGTTKKIFVK